MQNPESIGCYRKIKRVIIGTFLCLITCAMVFIICAIVYLSIQKDDYSAKVYDNPATVEEMFHNNKNLFMETVNILEDNEIFAYLYSIDRKSIFSPSIPKKEEYLTEKEYENICLFLNEVGPYEIGNSTGALHMVFFCKNHVVTIYYTETKGEWLEYFLNYVGQHSDVKLIDENWYFDVELSDIVRETRE